MRPWLVSALLMVGCQRDPSLFGFWEIVELKVDGEQVDQAGFLEFSEEGMDGMLSYGWSPAAGALIPLDQPAYVNSGFVNPAPDDFVESYREKGETYQTSFGLGSSETQFDVRDYRGDRVRLVSPAGYPYVLPAEASLQPSPVPLELLLVR